MKSIHTIPLNLHAIPGEYFYNEIYTYHTDKYSHSSLTCIPQQWWHLWTSLSRSRGVAIALTVLRSSKPDITPCIDSLSGKFSIFGLTSTVLYVLGQHMSTWLRARLLVYAWGQTVLSHLSAGVTLLDSFYRLSGYVMAEDSHSSQELTKNGMKVC